MTIDIKELAMVLGDATGYRMERGFFRKLTPQEQQAMQQPPPEMMMKDKMQQEKLQAQMQMKQLEGESASGQQEDQAMYDMAHTTLEKGLEAHLDNKPGGKTPSRKGK
jgi:hypothetical protein